MANGGGVVKVFNIAIILECYSIGIEVNSS